MYDCLFLYACYGLLAAKNPSCVFFPCSTLLRMSWKFWYIPNVFSLECESQESAFIAYRERWISPGHHQGYDSFPEEFSKQLKSAFQQMEMQKPRWSQKSEEGKGYWVRDWQRNHSIWRGQIIWFQDIKLYHHLSCSHKEASRFNLYVMSISTITSPSETSRHYQLPSIATIASLLSHALARIFSQSCYYRKSS